MKRIALVSLSVVLALVVAVGCLAPQGNSKVVGEVEFLAKDGGIVAVAKENLSAVEIVFDGAVKAKLADGIFGFVEESNGKTYVMAAKIGGFIKSGDEILFVETPEIPNVSVNSIVYSAVKAESYIKDYEGNPSYKLLGDFNEDSYVGIADFGMFVKAYLDYKIEGKYDSKFDIATEGKPAKEMLKAKYDGKIFVAKAEPDEKIGLSDFDVLVYNYHVAANRPPIIKEVKINGEAMDLNSDKWFIESEDGNATVEVTVEDYDGNDTVWEAVITGGKKPQKTTGEFTFQDGYKITIIATDVVNSKVGAKHDEEEATLYFKKVKVLWDEEKDPWWILTSGELTLDGTILFPGEEPETYSVELKVGKKSLVLTGIDPDITKKIRVKVSANGNVTLSMLDNNESEIAKWTDTDSISFKAAEVYDFEVLVNDERAGSFKVKYFKALSDAFKDLKFYLVEVPNGATVTSTGKLFMDDEHKTLKVNLTVDSTGVAVSAIKMGLNTATIKPSNLDELEEKGVIVKEGDYFYIEKPATFTFVIDVPENEGEYTPKFYAESPNDPGKEKIDSSISIIADGKSYDKVYVDKSKPTFKWLRVDCKPNESLKVYGEISDTGVSEQFYGTVTLLFDEGASKLELTVNEGEWENEFNLAELFPKTDRRDFNVEVWVGDEFGHWAKYPQLIETTVDGKDLYVDTIVKEPSTSVELWDNTKYGPYSGNNVTWTFDFNDKGGISKAEATATVDGGLNAVATPNFNEDEDVLTYEIAVEGTSKTEGNKVTVTVEATDMAGNYGKWNYEYYFDSLAATISKFGDYDPVAQDNASTVFEGGEDTIASDRDLVFSMENVYQIYVTYEATYGGERYYIDTPKTLLKKPLKGIDKHSINLQEIGLVVNEAEATLNIQLVDFAGNVSTSVVHWDKLTTENRNVFVDWDSLDEAAEDKADILDYSPDFGVKSPKPIAKEPVEFEKFELINPKIGSDSSEVAFTFYAAANAPLYIASDTDWVPVTEEWASSTNYTAYIDGDSAGKEATVTVILYNNESSEKWIGKYLTVEFKAAENDSDPLETIATVTFVMPAEIEPQKADIEASISVDQVTAEKKLIIEFPGMLKKGLFKEVGVADDVDVAIWDKDGKMRVAPVLGKDDLETTTATRLVFNIPDDNEIEVGGTYLLRISAKGLKYYIKGANGLYTSNTDDIIDIEIKANEE